MPSTPQVADEFKGRVIGPDDPDYDEARQVFMGAIDRRPALIVRAADAEGRLGRAAATQSKRGVVLTSP